MNMHPSGKFVGLMFRNKEFWMVPLGGGEPELIHGLQNVDDFAFWSDQRHILAVHAINPSDSELAVVDLANGASRKHFSAGNQTTHAMSIHRRGMALPVMERGPHVTEVPRGGPAPVRAGRPVRGPTSRPPGVHRPRSRPWGGAAGGAGMGRPAWARPSPGWTPPDRSNPTS